MIVLILEFLKGELQRGTMAVCPAKAKNIGEFFRLDAKAEVEEVAIGGSKCLVSTRTWNAPWFSVRLRRRNAAWAFARGEAFRTINFSERW